MGRFPSLSRGRGFRGRGGAHPSGCGAVSGSAGEEPWGPAAVPWPGSTDSRNLPAGRRPVALRSLGRPALGGAAAGGGDCTSGVRFSERPSSGRAPGAGAVGQLTPAVEDTGTASLRSAPLGLRGSLRLSLGVNAPPDTPGAPWGRQCEGRTERARFGSAAGFVSVGGPAVPLSCLDWKDGRSGPLERLPGVGDQGASLQRGRCRASHCGPWTRLSEADSEEARLREVSPERMWGLQAPGPAADVRGGRRSPRAPGPVFLWAGLRLRPAPAGRSRLPAPARAGRESGRGLGEQLAHPSIRPSVRPSVRLCDLCAGAAAGELAPGERTGGPAAGPEVWPVAGVGQCEGLARRPLRPCCRRALTP